MALHYDTVDTRARFLEGLVVEERRIDVNGIDTSMLESGQGPPLVLVHGAIQAGGVIWWRVIPRLAKTYRVIAPDLPGLGASAPANPLEAATVAGWLDRLIGMTCDQPPVVVAHSAPGALAARFAVERGERVRRLVLVDAAGLGPFRPSPRVVVALLRSSLRPSVPGFERFMRRVTADLDRIRKEDSRRWEALGGYVVSRAVIPEVKQAMRQLVKAGTRRIADADLRSITVPTVLVWGRQDPLIRLRIAEAASARLGWPLRVVEEAGHLPHVEQPDAFVDALHVAAT